MQLTYSSSEKRQVNCLSLIYLVTLLFFSWIPLALQAQTNPPIEFYDWHDRWTASVADASQCRSYSFPGSSFVKNGYAEIDGGNLQCFGTQTTTYSDGTISVRPVIQTISLSCGSGQQINGLGEILNPVHHSTSGHSYFSATCYCYRYLDVWNGSACVRSGQNIAFLNNSNSSLRPAGTNGISEGTFQVRVTQGTNPVPGVAVSFSVDVTPNSGGHEHHDVARPKGTLSGTQGTTDANGEVQVTFKAPEIAGIHTIKATCASCSNSPATKEIQVKVPNLVEMLPDTAKPATYTLVGVTGNHKSNHWFSSASVVTLGKVADAMFNTGWGAVGVNDGSLVWGGLFDIKGGWTPSHHEHRAGTEVDLSVTNPRQVTNEQKKKTYAELCKKDNTAFSIQTLWHQDDGYPEHFHMYLDGVGLTSQAGSGPCCARYKTTRVKLDKNGKPVQETVALCEETSPR